MATFSHNPPEIPAPVDGTGASGSTVSSYSHGLEVRNSSRLLFITGQIPERPDGSIPDNFAEQCEAIWNNIEAVLRSANMTVANLVKVTTFLTDRAQNGINAHIRRRHLGDHKPALTVIVVQTLDPQWLLEIEAIAAAED
jgi:2-iminobutanoate/2-iminopropanoate deaminase